MFIRIFNTNHPVVFFYLFLYALILKGSLFFMPYTFDHETTSLLSSGIFEELPKFDFWQAFIHGFSIILVFFQAVVFNQILIINRITELQTYVPAAIFITLSSLRPEFIILNPVNLCYILILPVFFNLFRLPYKEDAVENMFYSAFLISLASLIYFPAAYLLIVLVFGLIWLKNPSWREFLMPFVAFLLPYLFIGIYYFVMDKWATYIDLLTSLIPNTVGITFDSPGPWVLAGILFLLVLAGYFRSLRTPQQDVILYGKFLTVLLSAIIIGMGYTFFVEGDRLMFGYLFLAPLSIFIGSLFDVEKPKFFLRLLFWGLILLAAIFQWQHFKEMTGSAMF